jgi:hypothetical protein
MLKRADVALYAAKCSGRNRVVEASNDVVEKYAANGSGVIRGQLRRPLNVGRASRAAAQQKCPSAGIEIELDVVGVDDA